MPAAAAGDWRQLKYIAESPAITTATDADAAKSLLRSDIDISGGIENQPPIGEDRHIQDVKHFRLEPAACGPARQLKDRASTGNGCAVEIAVGTNNHAFRICTLIVVEVVDYF